MVKNCSSRSKRSIRLNAFLNSNQCKLKHLELLERLEPSQPIFLMPWNTLS